MVYADFLPHICLSWIYWYAIHIAVHLFRYDILWAPAGKSVKRWKLIISTSLLELHSENFYMTLRNIDGYLASVYWDLDDDQSNLVHIRPVRVIAQKMFVDN